MAIRVVCDGCGERSYDLNSESMPEGWATVQVMHDSSLLVTIPYLCHVCVPVWLPKFKLTWPEGRGPKVTA
jgi:hypothetical protein